MSETNNVAPLIKTKDFDTSQGLHKAGFQLITYENGTWIFLNNPKTPITFDSNKMAYSNMLTFDD